MKSLVRTGHFGDSPEMSLTADLTERGDTEQHGSAQKLPMTQRFPRVVAAIAFLIGMIGLGVSLPLLAFIKTSLLFLIGATAWGFLLWRAMSANFKEAFHVGWIWSSILHLGLLPLSFFIQAILGTEFPVPIFILVMFGLSLVGLFADLRLSAQTGLHTATEFHDNHDAEQGFDPNA
ncbi:MAG: hypothetical protein KDM63_05495 [Verrucomicrobiae bacterium]|nr:hypothetical protein [Verrucomicrobiae bacterium]